MPWDHRTFWLLPLLMAAALTVPILVVSLSRLGVAYSHHFHGGTRERLFLGAFGFFTAVVVVRGITVAIHYNFGPFHDVEMHGRHIHHLVWGILLLLLVGYAWLAGIDRGDSNQARWAARITSMVYGVGAALTLDEFALWLNLRDVYWQREGRESFEALALFAGLLGIGLFGRQFFAGVLRQFGRILRGRTA